MKSGHCYYVWRPDSNAHIEEGIRSIVALLDNDTMAKLRTARSREEVVALL